jgi:hypothetical protein
MTMTVPAGSSVPMTDATKATRMTLFPCSYSTAIIWQARQQQAPTVQWPSKTIYLAHTISNIKQLLQVHESPPGDLLHDKMLADCLELIQNWLCQHQQG